MNTNSFEWIKGKSGTLYYINQANGRVAGTVKPLGDDDFFEVIDLRKTEIIYKGLANAQRAVEAVPKY